MRFGTLTVAVAAMAVGGGVIGFAGLAFADDDYHDDPGVQACRHQVDKNEKAHYSYLYAACDPSRYDNRGSNGNSSRTVNGHPDRRKPMGQGVINGLF